MDFKLVNALLSVFGLFCFCSAAFVIPCICNFLVNLAEESAWRTHKLASDLGFIRVKKKFLFFKYYKYENI